MSRHRTGTTQDPARAARTRTWRRLASTSVLAAVLAAGCGGGGSEEALGDLEDQAARADETLRAVGERLQTDFDGTTTGPGRGRFGPCAPPSGRVSYSADVTWRSLVGSDQEVVDTAVRVLEDLGWTVEGASGNGFQAEREGVVATLNVGAAATAFRVGTACVGVPDADEVTDRPEQTFGLG